VNALTAAWVSAVAVVLGTLGALIAWRQGRAATHRQEMVEQALAQARKEFSTNEDSSKFQLMATLALAVLAAGLAGLGWLVARKN
jgi:hypothetical protein